MPRLTLPIIRSLHTGRTLYHHIEKNRDGTPLRARINGRLKVWVKPRTPQWHLPMKHGFKQCFYITPDNMEEWFTSEDEARLFHLGYLITNETQQGVPMNYWFIKCGSLPVRDNTLAGIKHFTHFEDALLWASQNLIQRKEKKGA